MKIPRTMTQRGGGNQVHQTRLTFSVSLKKPLRQLLKMERVRPFLAVTQVLGFTYFFSLLQGEEYFKAFHLLDLGNFLKQLSRENQIRFLKLNLLAASKEQRPDILRKIFPEIECPETLHDILCPKEIQDSNNLLFSKTVLAWAVENNDV